MYKRVGCALWTITPNDYWYLQDYINDKENEYGFKINNLVWHKDIDLVNQFDIIIEYYIPADNDQDKLIRCLGYLKDIQIDDEYGINKDYYICYQPIMVICQFDYLKNMEIIKEIDYKGFYEKSKSNSK